MNIGQLLDMNDDGNKIFIYDTWLTQYDIDYVTDAYCQAFFNFYSK